MINGTLVQSMLLRTAMLEELNNSAPSPERIGPVKACTGSNIMCGGRLLLEDQPMRDSKWPAC